ncbi:holo-[acyl-carrier-protein] synthase [Phytophthora cinnamomi]|uniref:holo-[acyl-carrier-protein] synthase n=1 Tax=Phytophthora cinnamomi TaxID=4785 RepID=UPI003559B3DB|nr:holo-[acyl-carrier-protein] synthase [Phytophthora cinnamomi]
MVDDAAAVQAPQHDLAAGGPSEAADVASTCFEGDDALLAYLPDHEIAATTREEKSEISTIGPPSNGSDQVLFSDSLSLYDNDNFLEALRSDELSPVAPTDDINISSVAVGTGYGSEELSDDDENTPDMLSVVEDVDSSGSEDEDEDSETFDIADETLCDIAASGWNFYDERAAVAWHLGVQMIFTMPTAREWKCTMAKRKWPKKVGPSAVVRNISKVLRGKLLQVMNFNIQQRQYVVAGENVNLEMLSLVLSVFTMVKLSAPEEVDKIIAESLARARKEKCERRATLLRTKSDPQVLERQLPLLVNRYTPNLVATPFSMERSYFEEVYEAMKGLCRAEFASAVQWITTQALLFSEGSVRCFVEVGPAPTLRDMALRTLQETSNISVSEFARGLADEAAAETATAAANAAVASAPRIGAAPGASPDVVAPVVQAAPAPAPKDMGDIKREDTDVKTLCSGKSAVQNEIVGDHETEFGGSVPEGAGEVPLMELASKVSGYNPLGMVANGLISKVVAR